MDDGRRGRVELEALHDLIRLKAKDSPPGPYLVPEILVGGSSPRRLVDVGHPYRFYLGILDAIAELGRCGGETSAGSLSPDDLVYLSFVRTFAALDGRIGTALSQIAFLPYLHERLAVTVFVSLPTGVIGRTDRKGRRGSPFAVSDPFDVDPSFADPLVPELPALDQYKALVQACGLLGIRAGSIVPLATLAVDSPLFAEVPALGFWWEAAPDDSLSWASPHDARTTPGTFPWQEISAESVGRFTDPPAPGEVVTAVVGGQGHHVGTVGHDGVRHTVTLARAFPGRHAGHGTLTWDDVAMLNFTRLAHPLPAGSYTPDLHDPSRPACSLAPAMIAWRHRVLGEEVFLIDVSGTVPDPVFRLARRLSASDREGPADAHADVVFVGEQVWRFDRFCEGIDAVVGPLVYCVSPHTGNLGVLVESLGYHLGLLEKRETTNPFLAGVANHDTMPPLPDLSPLLYVCYAFLPGAVPMVYSGNEFHAQTATNKEFGFNTSPELLRRQSSMTDDVLPLFNDVPLDWTALPTHDHHGRPVVDVGALLRSCADLSSALRPYALDGYGVVEIGDGEHDCLGYRRFAPEAPDDALIVLVNWDWDRPCRINWPYARAVTALTVNADLVPVVVDSEERVTLPPCSAAAWVTGAARGGQPAGQETSRRDNRVRADPHPR